MLHVGYGNYIQKSKILSITGADSAPLRRLRVNAVNKNKLINCTEGTKIDSLIHLEGGYVVASAINPETLVRRMEGKIVGE